MQFKGRVKRQNGDAAVGLTVELWAVGGVAATSSTTTDADGEWVFTAVAVGTWYQKVIEGLKVQEIRGDTETQVTILDAAGSIATDTVSEHTAAAGVTVDGLLVKDGGVTLAGRELLKKGADIASNAAITPGTDGNYFAITGVTGITSIASLQAGTIVIFRFDGILTITHNGTSLILQGAVNLTTAVGDVVAFISEGTGNWRELWRRLVSAAGSGTVTAVTGTAPIASSGGATPAISLNDDGVTYAKIQNVSATDKVLGRSTAGAGDVEEIACTAAGRALIDDADAAAQRATLDVNFFSTQAVVTASRTFGTVYQNTSAKPMFVTIAAYTTGAGERFQPTTDANAAPTTVVVDFFSVAANADYVFSFIVLSGNYYKVVISGTPIKRSWTEWV